MDTKGILYKEDLQDAVRAAADSPYLELRVLVTGETDEPNDSEDWIVLDGYNIPMIKDIRSFGNRLTLPIASAFRKRVENTFYQITSAFIDMSRKTPLGESDWLAHMDDEGHLKNVHELWVIVFNWGVEPSLRRCVWKHLLNVFPPDLTEIEREKYLAMKCKVYWQIQASWRREDQLSKTESLRDMVWKDVRRTDRTYPYFDVPDDHHHLTSLFNILVTYAVLNPDVSYAQGMSDLAAPLLVVMDDEAITFTCFTALMSRCRKHFLPDGKAMSLKFDHLTLLVQKFDPELYKYLMKVEADDMFFCYRWLVLDLKREFQFDDSLQIMEVIWSSLLPPPPKDTPQSPSSATFNTANKLQCSLNSSAVLRSEGYSSLPYSYQSLVSANNDQDFADEDEYAALNLDDFGGKLALVSLPDPYHLGDGNPFSLFLCLAILILHRERVFNEQDYNSLASSFDKKVRKHDAEKVLTQARQLFSQYLRHCELVDNNEFVSLQKPKENEKKKESWFDDNSCEIVSNASPEIQC
ncbi:TBC1 domain family member 25-like isoform X2 [Dendronephthya gigantea]|uniref:TBC1 domain family member 25-like isoform X2 n=1 Tax=Dendronephthya gigantea TaxID=151771 RepID=UPI00106DC100|nr:TBC1 domain family member 25-like isoform X2 [Dendronephthya gigantea]